MVVTDEFGSARWNLGRALRVVTCTFNLLRGVFRFISGFLGVLVR